MSVIYTLVMYMLFVGNGLTGTSTIEITGFDSMEACEAALAQYESDASAEHTVVAFAGSCIESTGA